jgi:hypothetical protein
MMNLQQNCSLRRPGSVANSLACVGTRRDLNLLDSTRYTAIHASPNQQLPNLEWNDMELVPQVMLKGEDFQSLRVV